MKLFTALSGNNNTHWKNPRYDQLLESAAREFAGKKRGKIYDEAQRILCETDLPILSLFTTAESTVLNPRFTGLEYSPMGRLVLRHVRPSRTEDGR